MSISHMQAQFAATRAAHLADPYPSLALRKDRLTRLEQALERFGDRLIAAMQADFGHRSAVECALMDITVPLADIRATRRRLRRWMRGRRPGMPLHFWPARGHVMPQPKGVVGVIAPWNFPVQLAVSPLAGALAAGNRVMVKPSELSPRTSEVLGEMIASAFAANEVSLHPGGPDLAAAFSALPFGHLLFTGSTAVGRLVAQAAAKNLTPVTLELGGKSPAVVGEAADLRRAAARIAYGKFTNAGQICVAPDYVLVPRARMAPFAEAVAQALRGYGGDFATSPDYTAIITDQHRARICALVAEAEAAGAQVIRLGDTSGAATRKEAPVLVLDPPQDLRLMREEIFGPILPIVPYDSRAEALAYVAARPSPLALYLFTADRAERAVWMQRSLSGGASINETIMHVAADTLPFGGVGESGMGAYHGQVGFETFSHMKSVLYQPRLNGAGLFAPPFGARKQRLIAGLRRWL